MKTAGKIVAGTCIFSTLFMGCYSSVLIDPTDDGREKLSKGDIEVVITKDGTKYEFTTPAQVDSNAIVGIATPYRQVSIPFSEIQSVQVLQSKSDDWVVGLVAIGAVAVIVVAVVSNLPPSFW